MKYTDNSEPPSLFKEWTAITTIASVMERKCFLPWGELTFYPNIYVVLVGPSGSRKGTAMNVGSRMLRDIGKIKMAAEAVTREALIRALKNAEEQHIDPQTGDVNYHASLTIFSQELTVFLGYNNVQLMSDLADWYDCRDQWKYETKNMGTDDVMGVWVNLMGATTPELIRSAIPQDLIGGGLSSRIIFVYEPKKGKSVPDPFLTNEDLALREKLVNDLDRIHTMRGKFRVTDEMLEKWVTWYVKQDQNPPFTDPNFEGYMSRRPNHVLRLCMIISASESDDMVITGKTFDRVVDLLHRTEQKMLNTFRGMGRSSKAEVMNKLMATVSLEKEISSNELYRRYMADIEDIKEFSSLIASLQQVGFCKYDQGNAIITYNPDWEKRNV